MDGKAIDITKLNLFLYGKMDPDSVDIPSEQFKELWDTFMSKIDSYRKMGIGVLMLTSTVDEKGSMGFEENLWNGNGNPTFVDGYRLFHPAFPRRQLDPLEKLDIYEKEYLPIFIDYTVKYNEAWEMYTKKGLWMFPESLISFEEFLKSKYGNKKI